MPAGVILTTVHTQDMYDKEGDAARGRQTLPLVMGGRSSSMDDCILDVGLGRLVSSVLARSVCVFWHKSGSACLDWSQNAGLQDSLKRQGNVCDVECLDFAPVYYSPYFIGVWLAAHDNFQLEYLSKSRVLQFVNMLLRITLSQL